MKPDLNKNIDQLTSDVKNKVGNPVNELVVVAAVESFGIRNIDVRTDYGMESIKKLASHIYKRIKSENPFEIKKNNIQELFEEQQSFSVSNYSMVRTKLFLYYFPLGSFHFFPVFLQIITIIIFGYSLWIHVEFNRLQSTAVVLGIIFGLVLTGGYTQVIGRQASFHYYHHDLKTAKKVIYDVIKSGIKGMLTVFAFIAVVNLILYLYPFLFLGVVFIYAFLIGTLLLFLAPMHTIKKRWVVSVAILIALGIAILLFKKTNLHVYFTHWIGIGTAIVIMAGYLKFFFRNVKANTHNADLNSGLSILHENYKYFLYGTFVFVFIFIDRIVAWSATAESIPFIVYYEKYYEMGMDIAILVLFLLAGLLEYNIASFTRLLYIRVKSYSHSKITDFNKQFTQAYLRKIVLLLVISAVTFYLIYGFLIEPWGYQAHFDDTLNAVSVRTAILGSIAYLFFTWGMLNSLYLFSLNQTSSPLYAIIIAMFVNLFIGLILSRTVSYEYSAIGMIIGAIVFALITFIACKKYFNDLDYYYNAYR